MAKKIAIGVFVLAIGEILISALGFVFLVPVTLDFIGFNVNYHSLGDFVYRRVSSTGLEKMYLFWPVFCILAFPIAIGMFIKKEWARKATLWFFPSLLIFTFPLIFSNISILLQKINIMFGFSLAIKAESAFWPLLLKILTPWLIYFCMLVVIVLILRKYLCSPDLKELFK